MGNEEEEKCGLIVSLPTSVAKLREKYAPRYVCDRSGVINTQIVIVVQFQADYGYGYLLFLDQRRLRNIFGNYEFVVADLFVLYLLDINYLSSRDFIVQ